MTAAPRKGRKVSFAADTAAPQADPWSQISTLRFMIHPLYGGELLVDFTGLRPRGLALAFARSLFMLAAPRGPIMVRSSLKTSANHQIGRASCRERVCQYVSISVVPVSFKTKIHNTKQAK